MSLFGKLLDPAGLSTDNPSLAGALDPGGAIHAETNSTTRWTDPGRALTKGKIYGTLKKNVDSKPAVHTKDGQVAKTPTIQMRKPTVPKSSWGVANGYMKAKIANDKKRRF